MTQAGARSDAIAAGGLLVVALFLGGGNWLFPLQRMIVEIAAVLVLAWFCLRPGRMPQGNTTGISTKVIIGLIVATLLLLLVQLVPVSPSIWHSLPGREHELDVYTAAGAPDRWAPISLNSSATRDTIAFFLVPLSMFVAVLRIDRDAQRRLLMVIAAFCLLNGFLVMAQFQGFSWLTFYSTYGRPGTGLFANKNHSAVFLVAAMPAVAWAIMESRQTVAITTRRWIAVGTIGFLSLAVFGCLSRAGLGLLPLGIAVSAVILAPGAVGGRRTAVAFGCFVALMLLLVVILPKTDVVARALARFDATSDLRYQFWPVVKDGIRAYFPVGSGFGTFQPVFAALEPLSIVKPTYVNHAHSDYLEIALEGGLVAVILMLAFIVWFAATAIVRLRTCRRGQVGFAPVAIAVAGITELLLHSVLDYPLRTLALATLASVYCAVLSNRPTALDLQELSRYRRGNRSRARPEVDRNRPVESLREFR